MTAAVGIISMHGFRMEVCGRNQPNKTKLVFYKLLAISFTVYFLETK